MNLIKTSFWTGLSTLIRILAGIVTTKIMAIYIGPAGVALLGNFTNITGIMTTFANGAINSGITKYISDYDTENERQNVISNAIKISLIFSFVICLLVTIFHKQLAYYTFGDIKYGNAYIIFGFFIFLFSSNALVSSVFNGYRYIRHLVLSGIISSIISVVLAFIITTRYGLFGALINSAIAQIFILLVNLYFIRRLQLIKISRIFESFNKSIIRGLFKFALMGLTSTLVVPTSVLFIRKYILSNFSAAEAGYVQGVWNISAAYLMVVTSTLSIYYLPTLSRIKNKCELRKEIINGYKIILPMAIIGGSIVYIFRDLIISMLYTPSFEPMRYYFTFQIIGDTLKIAAFIIGYINVAKAYVRRFISIEIVFSLTYLLLAIMFMKLYGSIGVTYAYSLNYLICLIYLVFLYKDLLFIKK